VARQQYARPLALFGQHPSVFVRTIVTYTTQSFASNAAPVNYSVPDAVLTNPAPPAEAGGKI
jgi:hypothetical protein